MATVSLSDDGNIKIEVGEPDDVITQLGKRSDGKFQPYTIATRYEGINAYYVHVVKDEYLPSVFDNSDNFVETLRLQSATNEYVQNYSDIAGEYLNDYLKKVGIIDENTYFIMVPSSPNDLTDTFFKSLIGMSNKFSDEAITIKDEVTADDLVISENAPKEAVEYFENLFNEMDKVDAYYDFEDLKIDTKNYIYLNGFINVLWDQINIPDGAEVILVRDRLRNGHIIYDAVDQLSEKFNVVGIATLFRQL